MNTHYFNRFLQTAILLAVPLEATASSIFSNLTGTDTLGGYVVGLYPPSSTFTIGFNFVVPAGSDYQFTGGAFLASIDIGTNRIDLTLYSDSGGSPGVALETVSLADVLTSSIAIVPFSSVINPVLAGGQQYWLTAAITNPSSSRAYWWGPNPLDPGLLAGSPNGGPWEVSSLPRGAFEITGDPVPEPSTLLLVGVGLFVALGGNRLLTRAARSRMEGRR